MNAFLRLFLASALVSILPQQGSALNHNTQSLPPVFPDFPPETVDAIMDMRQMQYQVGALPPLLPPHREDPNRPDFVVPTDSSYKYWTDVEGYSPYSPANYHVKRSQWGEWTNFTESGEQLYSYSPIDPLVCEDGTEVNNLDTWQNKRSLELLKHCQYDVWGVVPQEASELGITWKIECSQVLTYQISSPNAAQKVPSLIPYQKKYYLGTIDTSLYPAIRHAPVIKAVLYQPLTNNCPVIIQLGHGIDRQPTSLGLDECLSRGWGYMLFENTALQPDNGKYLSDYLIGLVNKGNWRKPEDWGAMAAWSWGLSRIIDVLSNDSTIAIDKIGVTGHSRYGKTALLAMVYEPRLAIAYVSGSGVLGAAPIRSNWGENLEVIASEGSYHWAAGNVFKWVGPLYSGQYMPRKKEKLKVDAHILLGLVAPRPIFVNAGSTDYWANPMGMYCTCRDASPVYHLYGRSGLVMQDRTPIVDKDYIDGNIGFRLHNGGHNDQQDWPTFARFASKYFK